uniref:THAP-type domain-containing protein n=1 Tax=Panagrolaimus sp. JU765 TaxID=591449 RepID=A0AC34QHK1_9BILA
MPTTCGFPNCKFRSRYRGQEDNRHFYRIPKRPLVLRQRWLKAIGRTEETVVSQLRICSAHFEGGEKKEGDIPVPDPQLDSPLSIPLPPKETKTSDRRRNQKFFKSNNHTGSSSSSEANGDQRRKGNISAFHQSDFANIYANGSISSFPSDFLNHIGSIKDEKESKEELPPRFSGQSPNDLKFLPGFPVIFPMMNRFAGSKPLIALLDGRDCSIEMPLLKDICTVAFCDAQATSEIHEKVLNEAVAAFMWNTIKLEKADLQKFKALKVLVCLSPDVGNVNLDAASELGIAVCNIPGVCLDEIADSTMSLILNLFRRTHWIARSIESGKPAHTIEQIRDLSSGTRRVRDSTLGIIGLGQTGSAVVARAKAFGFNIIAYDPYVTDGTEKIFGIERCETLESLLKRADCISLHCPLNSETAQIINEDSLKKLKAGAFIVNAGRPELIHEAALISALRSGHVKAAALDTQHLGDMAATLPLSLGGQLINTGRTSGLSDEAAHELRATAAKELRRALMGRIPQDLRFCVNKERIISQTSNAGNSGNSLPTMNPSFNPLAGMNLDAYNGLPLPSSFGSLPYANSLFMGINPQLLMNNAASALNNFQLPGGNAGMFSGITGQSPKSSNGIGKRSRTATPMNASISNIQSASTSPTPGNSAVQIDGEGNKSIINSDSDHDVTGDIDDNETNDDVQRKESNNSEMVDPEIPEKKFKMDMKEDSMEIKNENH